jgi:FAD/FMN-containing dehydrogenase
MILRPSTPEALATALRDADVSRVRVDQVDLSALHRVLEHAPEDMTVTVEAGATLASLQRHLAARGQWVPIDPPHPDRLTIAELLGSNASGPRRYGCGTIRDHLIGLRVALAGGQLIRSGGKVVKNVAGYDLMKLFVGARGSLGVVVEATFKLMPIPEQETFVAVRSASLADVEQFRRAILDSELTPTVFDLHNLDSGNGAEPDLVLVLGFSGVRQAVEYQVGIADRLGIREPATLEFNERFHAVELPAPGRFSVLPSRLLEMIRLLGSQQFVARAGNGILHHRSEVPAPQPPLPRKLIERVKQAFDPNSIFLPAPL